MQLEERRSRRKGRLIEDHDDVTHDYRRRSQSRDRRRGYRERSRSRERHREIRDRRENQGSEGNDEIRKRLDNQGGSQEKQRRRRDSLHRRRRSRSPVDTYREGRSDRVSDTKVGTKKPSKRHAGEGADISTNSKSDVEGIVDARMDQDILTIKSVMGFSGFRSTKNTKVPGNNVGAVRKNKEIKARQYMNRVGGFNRPLSPGR